MNILHYSLGLPPYRTGGLTNISLSIMLEQVKKNSVFLLWPGEIHLKNKKTCIKKNKTFKGIINFRIINPLPVPLMGGIINPYEYMTKCNNIQAYENLLDLIKPDVIHIHSLMGLHLEFYKCAKKRNIKIVFTTHDYFGICPKVMLFNKKICYKNNRDCSACNSNAVSLKEIYLKQSSIFRLLKNKMKKMTLRKKYDEICNKKNIFSNNDYKKVENYYLEIFNEIDCFHYNSNLTKKVYDYWIGNKNGLVINLPSKSLATVNLKERKKIENEHQIQIGFIGSISEAKGFYILEEVIQKVNSIKQNKYILNLYGVKTGKEKSFIKQNKYYKNDNISEAFSKLDIVIIPSIWNETFGLGTTEALANDLPVIVSNNVGSKEILNDSFGWTYKNKDELFQILLDINRHDIYLKKKNILKFYHPLLIEDFCDSLYGLYKK